MSTVFVNIGLSLDGYMAPEGMTMTDPGHMNWGAKWGAMMAWILNQQYFRETLKFGPGGETGPVNDMVRHTFERTGAHIMGKRMFDQGEIAWLSRSAEIDGASITMIDGRRGSGAPPRAPGFSEA